METNPFSIENILKKDSSPILTSTEPISEVREETVEEPSKATAALSLAAKLAGMFKHFESCSYLMMIYSCVFNILLMKQLQSKSLYNPTDLRKAH